MIMENSALMRLDLRAPLKFTKRSMAVSWFCTESAAAKGPAELFAEQVLCFKLKPWQSRSIEPVPEKFLGKLLFSGYVQLNIPQTEDSGSADNSTAVAANTVKHLEIPAGLYVFTQTAGLLEKNACIDMAIEQQKDGLWEKYKLQNILYIRLLYEDGRYITQFFRPIRG